MRHSAVTFNLLACSAVLALGASALQAQTVYRIVGPDGKVTFSDKAPLDVSKSTATSASGKPLAAADGGGSLPYELRQVVARYPVTLYSSAACVPCNSGRLMLQSRGIPFSEYTVTTPEDGDALKRLSGDNSLPVLTIGGQKIKGFSEAEWTQFLNAANYPASSQLPASYRYTQPKPLVATQKPATATGQAEAQAGNDAKPAGQEPDNAPPPSSAANPSGIKF